ncbi:MAG TPA: hypothetical protein VIG48_07020 [Jatrophihabitans sp.]
MADLIADSTRSIPRRSLAYWAALAVLLIFVSSAGALFVATYLADLI